MIADPLPTASRPTAPAVWWQALRPTSFPASIVPVVVGSACAVATQAFSPLAFGVTLLGSVTLHAGTNLLNDYFDWRAGSDRAGVIGPRRVILEGLLSPMAVLRAGVVAFAIGSGIGLYLALRIGWPVLVLGLIGVPLAIGYTAPPLKLAYRGLGEVVVFILMGPLMVLGSFLVHQPATGVALALAASVPVGCLVAAILQANNVRDLEEDRAVGKITLATRLGRRGARLEYDLLLVGAYLWLPIAAALGGLPWTALLALASLPSALPVRKLIATQTSPQALSPTVPGTAQLHLRFGVLLALGISLGALLGWHA